MLRIVPTPIGNLKDVTLRALEALREADAVLCEDTRRTQTLLRHYEIQKPLISYHEYSGSGKLDRVMGMLREGRVLALVSDGGTPLVSDPGFDLVRAAVREGLPVEALPGPSALTTALSVSGLPAAQVSFFGFLPQKSVARRRALEAVADRKDTLVFFESPYRVVKALREMAEVFGEREAALARELTKKFEEIIRGKLSDLVRHFEGKQARGECVILVAGKGQKEVWA